MSRIVSGVVGGAVVAGAAVGVAYGLWYLWQHGTAGPGFGFGKGGDSIFKTGGTASPEDADSGPGGAHAEPGSGDDAGKGDGKDTQTGGGDSSGGMKPNTGDPGTGQSGGSGSGSGKSDDDGKGTGGGGGGIGGGSGGGVGTGEGSGTSDGADDKGGSSGDDDGGGEAHGVGYDPWGGQVIAEDLPPPDLSAAKLDEVTNIIQELVGGSILDPGLPPPLHAFDPMLGGLLLFWADVALHKVWTLPPGRLDPDNPTHVPWINLWLDILAEVSALEKKINADFDDELEDEDEVGMVAWCGLGCRSSAYRSLDVRSIERRGARIRKDPLLRALYPRVKIDAHKDHDEPCCDGCALGLGCVGSCAA